MSQSSYCVYKHTSPNGMVYIGLTKQKVNDRWKRGKGYAGNSHFTNAINKYGWDAFSHEIVADNLSKEEAEDLEIALIERYDSANPDHGYNFTLGGRANTPTQGTKDKISASMASVWSDPDKRENIVKGMVGIKRSLESKENISKAQKKRFEDPKEREAVSNRQKGRKKSEDAKRKTSGSLKVYYADEENRRRLREIRIKARNRATPIICVETGERFDAVIDASKKYNIQHQNIIKVCRGQRAKAGGFSWKYAQE